ncbi:MAG: hypothetical protein JWP11_3814 [Frankiales bacterium]|nr:hypothetical protein [Frankiales bacterium]
MTRVFDWGLVGGLLVGLLAGVALGWGIAGHVVSAGALGATFAFWPFVAAMFLLGTACIRASRRTWGKQC